MAALPTTIQPVVEGLVNTPTSSVTIIELGDGYTARALNGINPIKDQYSLSWIGNSTNIMELYNFLVKTCLLGLYSFTWTPPNTVTSKSWTCKDCSLSYTGRGDIYKLTAQFKQEFDLI